MKARVINAVQRALERLTVKWQLKELPSIVVEIPKNESFGDMATTVAMGLAPTLKRAPRKIAEEIVSELEKGEHDFEQFDIAGPGFINFTFKEEFFRSTVNKIVLQGSSDVDRTQGRGKSVLIEYVSANPTGPLHFGHGRGAAVGNALANMLSAAGYQVNREFYINDAGRQVELLGKSVYAAYQNELGANVPFPEDGYKGDYIFDAARELAAQRGDKFKNQPFEECSDFFIQWSTQAMLNEIKHVLSEFGITFDIWQSEKSLFEYGKVNEAIEYLKEQKKAYESDGALWFRSSAFGDEKDRVLLKSDGTYTYFASDVAFHKQKAEGHYDMLINIWGADHHGYIPRIKAAVSAFGFDPERLKVLLVQMVTLLSKGKPVQMSKRAGSFITLKDVLDDVGPDIAKFIFLTRRPDSHLEFDLEAAKEQSSENPVFYVQYANARINSIMRKADPALLDAFDLMLLTNKEEMGIMKKLCLYPVVFEGAVRALEPHRITYYLQELSSIFHSYYNKHRVISDDEGLTRARLALCRAVQIVIREGLEVLGVHIPERM
jgi:arginyl-tRNA synthetase